MKESKTICGILLDFGAGLRGNCVAQGYSLAEPPLQAELFSRTRMEQHGNTPGGFTQVECGTGSGPASDEAG